MKVKILFFISLYVLICVLVADLKLRLFCMMACDVLLAVVLLYPMPLLRRRVPLGVKAICLLLTGEWLLAFLEPELIRRFTVPLHLACLYGCLIWLLLAPYLHRSHLLLRAKRLRALQIYAEDMSRSYLFFAMALMTTLSVGMTLSSLGQHRGIVLTWCMLTLPLAMGLYVRRLRALLNRRPPFLFMGKALRGNVAKVRREVAAAQKNRFGARPGRSIYGRIVEYMTRSKPFLSPTFSLSEMSRKLGTNTMYISRAVNLMTGRTFPAFVNYFRVRYAVALYRSNPLLRVHMLADMVGFNSTVTFTTAFKLETGYAPGEYFGLIQEGKVMPELPESPSRTQAPGWKDEILAF